jgi:hypothetical protein
MTQPSFVPISEADQVRPSRRLEVPGGWSPSRPADHRSPGQPTGRRLGTPGPDQGFALRLAHRLAPTFVLTPGESVEDVVTGCALVAARRAALFGRAPCVYDVALAASLFGFTGDAPPGLVARRGPLFSGVGHHYAVQRTLVDGVPEDTLRLGHEEVARRSATEWPELLGVGVVPVS